MALRVRLSVERLAEVERLGLWRAPESVDDFLDAARGLGVPEPSALVHGDLPLRRLLVDDDCGAAAVIDWIDVCCGDPAIDLPLFWCLLPAAAHGRGLRGCLRVWRPGVFWSASVSSPHVGVT